MGLRINNNLEAANTLRNLNTAQTMFSKSMQHLSSGKRINSAADDAAGYAISNKLQAQSTGLNQAQSNAQDGISLVQTADGGLQTSQGLLQRLRQLAVQSANDTNTQGDRTAIQSEADQITQEITQISTTTQFNTKTLLGGGLGSTATLQGGPTGGLTGATVANTTIGNLAAGTYNFAVTAHGNAGATTSAGAALTGAGSAPAVTDFLSTVTKGYQTNSASTVTNTFASAPGNYTLNIAGSTGSGSINVVVGAAGAGDTYQNVMDKVNALTNQTGVTASFTAATGFSFTNSAAGSAQGVTVSGVDVMMKGLGIVAAGGAPASTTGNDTVTANGTDGVATLQLQSGAGAPGPVLALKAQGNLYSDTSGSGFRMDLTGNTATTGSQLIGVTSGALSLQVGANAGQNIQVSIADMGSHALGVQGASATQALDLSSSATAAGAAITTIDTAIQTVSTQAANLGAVQNRLSAAMSNLAIGSENMTAAYSSITNVNMAQESTNLATAQILQQASTAMLAQANQAPQGVLKLLG